MKVLVIDVGGTSIKLLATGRRTPLKIPSGPRMTAARMVRLVRAATSRWNYSAITIGYPGPVKRGRPVREPKNLAKGWVGFDFTRAFERPVKVVNDAALQALGSYRGGRMLFLGLGTGLGTALIVDGVLAPMELAHLPYKKGRTYEEYVGKTGLERMGVAKWRRHVADVVKQFRRALEADYVVVGGGNATRLGKRPAGVRRGHNGNAFIGGYRLWQERGDPGRRDAAQASARRHRGRA
jgi:predicted NBD/HSP70 family sugar kinase